MKDITTVKKLRTTDKETGKQNFYCPVCLGEIKKTDEFCPHCSEKPIKFSGIYENDVSIF